MIQSIFKRTGQADSATDIRFPNVLKDIDIVKYLTNLKCVYEIVSRKHCMRSVYKFVSLLELGSFKIYAI